jgi:endonuclease/exonuclease/phosphatase family metal-dependent hydrolase
MAVKHIELKLIQTKTVLINIKLKMKTTLTIAFCFLLPCIKATAQTSDSLRVITYNIHHANPPSKPGVIDTDAFIAIFKKYPADMIALQEVDVNTKRSGNIDEARVIADGLGMHVFFAKAIDHDGGEYGVALLSRFPLKDTRVIRLPMDSTVKGEQRVLATATIKLPSGRSIVIACTHLDHQRDPKSRELQVGEINAYANKSAGSFVIAGDLNAEQGSGVIQLFDQAFQRTCDACPFTFPETNPNRTIDFIGFKKSIKAEVLSHQVLPEPFASDHLPVRAVILFRAK